VLLKTAAVCSSWLHDFHINNTGKQGYQEKENHCITKHHVIYVFLCSLGKMLGEKKFKDTSPL
jgi:hypothetical protein